MNTPILLGDNFSYIKTYTSPDAKTLDPEGKGFGRDTLAGLEGPLEGDGVLLGPLVIVKPGLLLFIKFAKVRLELEL